MPRAALTLISDKDCRSTAVTDEELVDRHPAPSSAERMRTDAILGAFRCKMSWAVAMWTVLFLAHPGAAGEGHTAVGPEEDAAWWYRYPTFAALSDPEGILDMRLRLVIGNIAADPGWGPYAQHANSLRVQSLLGHGTALARAFETTREQGVRWITWIETFGDCVMYAAAIGRETDGSFPERPEQPGMTKLARTAWNWENGDPPPGETYRWVGLHNSANNEDFVMPAFGREQTGFPTPTYPDGRAALGWSPEGHYPANARIYDACGAKDINGRIDLSGEGYKYPERANTIDPETGERSGPTEGLYPMTVGPNELPSFPGRQVGDVIYVSHMAAAKDPACPFWLDYARISVRRVLADGLDGVWCDNFGCYNNFGMPPIGNGFGDWSEHRFREFLALSLPEPERERAGVGEPSRFAVREYLKRKAVEFGAGDASVYADPAWCDPRWLDDPIWNAYKVFKQRVGQEALRGFYRVVKEEATRAGRPEFCVAGNDVPVYTLGWARDAWLDMVSSEQTPGWWVTTGSRGIMLPPVGKYGVVYRAALAHQQGPYATMWYSLGAQYQQHGESAELGKVLAAEAFANSTFLKHGPPSRYVGTEASHRWWNRFVVDHERTFGRRFPVADVGVLYSPDNQLAEVVPGRHALDHDHQPHSFAHWGFATALIDAHIPYRVVTDWKLTPEELRGLRTFVVPSAECLDDGVLPVLDEWVRNGGRLVITGAAGARAGTAGLFSKRDRPLLQELVGKKMSEGVADVQSRQLGSGTVVWSPAPQGMEYYVKDHERPRRLEPIVELVGASEILEGSQLPDTVGAFCWRSADGRTRFVDLVNYGWDAASDRVTPARDLRFRLPVPDDTAQVVVTAVSPEEGAVANATVQDGWADVTVPQLVYFVSVKLTILESQNRQTE